MSFRYNYTSQTGIEYVIYRGDATLRHREQHKATLWYYMAKILENDFTFISTGHISEKEAQIECENQAKRLLAIERKINQESNANVTFS